MDFWSFIGNKKDNATALNSRCEFVVVSGDFPKSGTALPLSNRKVRAAALKEFYLHKGKTFLARIKINVLQIFNFAFVWRLFFKKIFFVNNNPENFLYFLSSQLPAVVRRQLTADNSRWPHVICSFYVGSRKFILPLFRSDSGKLLGVAKVYFPESVEYGENEAKTLAYLDTCGMRNFLFPVVLAEGYFKGSFVVVLSSPGNLKKINGITERHTEFLKRLSEKTGRKTLFIQSNFYREFQKEIDFLKSKIPGKFISVAHFWNKSVQNLKDKEFVFSLVKREFPFFEMFIVSRHRTLKKAGYFVLDWEQARFGYPPIFDVFSLLMSTSRFKKGEYTELYKKNVIDLFFSSNKKQAIIKEMFGFWNVSSEDAYWFFLLFLIDQLYIHLHVNHNLSAYRIIALLEKVRENENDFQKKWLGRISISIQL